MASRQEIRDRIVERVERQGVVKGETLQEVKTQLGLSEYSNTQFGLALRSLHYKHHLVRVVRPRRLDIEQRPYVVTVMAT